MAAWTAADKSRALALAQSGFSHLAISIKLGRSRCSVSNAVRKKRVRRAEVTPSQSAIPFEGLSDRRCKYALTADLPHKFCGAPSIEGSAYCTDHHEICNPGKGKP